MVGPRGMESEMEKNAKMEVLMESGAHIEMGVDKECGDEDGLPTACATKMRKRMSIRSGLQA